MVRLPIRFDVVLPSAIWKSHIVRVIARASQKNYRKGCAERKVITVRDMRAKVTKRAETEVERARKALDRAEAAELKKENARIAAQKKLQKQLHKEFKVYLKARPALVNLLK